MAKKTGPFENPHFMRNRIMGGISKKLEMLVDWIESILEKKAI